MSIEIRRGTDRAATRTDWLTSRHTFSFGDHYEPDNVSFGPLIAFNEDVLAPAMGFERHRHRDVELLTWVISGSLTYGDTDGRIGTATAGELQVVSAGTGIEHTETNADPSEPTHYVQMWIQPDRLDVRPAYVRRRVRALLEPGEWTVVASGRGDEPLAAPVRNQDADLSVAVLDAGQTLGIATDDLVFLFVAVGSVEIELSDGRHHLGQGDELRISRDRADEPELVPIKSDDAAELLMWQFRRVDTAFGS